MLSGRRLLTWALLAVGALTLLGWGCRSRSTGAGSGSSQRSELVVFAAASLTEAFADIERAFERRNPDVDVRVSYAGSQALRVQIEHGAAADVFASANAHHMATLRRARLVGRSRVFARNAVALVVPRANRAKIRSLRDVVRAKRLVVGVSGVPIGAYTHALLARAARRYGEDFRRRVLSRVASREANVRLVLAKVALGEADAAFVYRTDAAASQRVRRVTLPPELAIGASYHIGRVARGGHAAAAARFVAFVTSPAGRAALRRRGFATPPARSPEHAAAPSTSTVDRATR